MGRVSLLLVSAIAQFTGLINNGVAAEPVSLAARGQPSVDLGYSIYQGSYDASSRVNSFKGYVSPIKFAIELFN